MRSRISSLLLVCAVFGASQAAAQDPTEPYDWRWQRADAHAPFGIMNDWVLEKGELMIGYRFLAHDMDGVRLGDFEIPVEEVLEVFQSTPYAMSSQTHAVTGQYAVLDVLSIMATVPFVTKDLDQITRDGDLFSPSSSGIGDIRADVLVNVFESGPYKAHVSGGLSVPTGSLDEEGTRPGASGDAPLPYVMQTGSGTFDLYPGLTIQAMNAFGSVGLQGMATLRLGENDNGYTLGNRTTVSGWFAIPIGDQLSFSGRMQYTNWGSISGSDPSFAGDVSRVADPTFFPELSGGSRLDLPLGVNLHLDRGPLAGHRLGVEAIFPVSQDLDGPQLQENWAVVFGWQTLLNW
jgi:hypothetical protein